MAAVVHYSWLPLWLAIALTLGALGLWSRWKSRTTPRTTEGNVLVWIVGPVLLYLALAILPGALGAFQGFDDAQNLATPQLLFGHGLWPWRDLFIVHGLLGDVFTGAIGMFAFGNTRWGVTAGTGIYVIPAFWIATYYFAAYFSRRNRILLLGLGALIVVSGFVNVNSPELLVVPIGLVLFARVLVRSTWGRCAALSLGVVVSMILVPEATVFEIVVLPLVVVYEFCTRRKGAALRDTYARSLRCLTVTVAAIGAWVVYLALTGSLSAFVHFYLEFSSDNAIAKGLPVQWVLHRDLRDTFYFFAPMALWLLTFGRVATKCVRRSSWSARDWTMVAAATIAILDYLKVIQRADAGHAAQVFVACVPLLILWGIETLEFLDRAVLRVVRARASKELTARWELRSLRLPVTIGAVMVVALSARRCPPLAPFPVDTTPPPRRAHRRRRAWATPSPGGQPHPDQGSGFGHRPLRGSQ